VQRNLRSTVLAVVLAVIVVVWLASDPPPAQVNAARARAVSDAQAAAELAASQARSAAQDESAPETPRETTADTGIAHAPTVPAPPTTELHQNEPGLVEVLVLFDGEPRAGASVRLVPQNQRMASDEPRSALSDDRGLVLFGPLEGDISASVEISIAPDATVTLGAFWRAREPTSRLVASLGSGGVEGRVYGADGNPLADAPVTLDYFADLAPNGSGFSVRSGVDGSYRIAGVARGTGTLTARNAAGTNDRRVELALGDREWKHVDFGGPVAASHWTGRLMLASGTPVRGRYRIQMRMAKSGETRIVDSDEQSQLAADLPPGEYVPIASVGGGTLELEPFELGVGNFAHDLRVPGMELWGRVEYTGASPEPAAILRALEIQVQSSTSGAKYAPQDRREDGRYALIVPDAGEYVVTTAPQLPAGVGASGLHVQLGPTRDSVELDFSVTDP
jgi:hypothetical protein